MWMPSGPERTSYPTQAQQACIVPSSSEWTLEKTPGLCAQNGARQIFLGIKEVYLKRRGTFTLPACPALPALKMWQLPASESDSNHMLGPAYLQGPTELPRLGAMHEKPLGRASLGQQSPYHTSWC